MVGIPKRSSTWTSARRFANKRASVTEKLYLNGDPKHFALGKALPERRPAATYTKALNAFALPERRCEYLLKVNY